MENNDFLNSLRQEIINTQNHRFKFAIQKLIFITGLLGVGSIAKEISGETDFKYLIYFVPFVSFMFDIYILGENFGIRRIGNYLKFANNVSKDEKYWEYILNIPKNANRDIFAVQGNFFSTFISIILSFFLIIIGANSDGDIGNLKSIIANIDKLDKIWMIIVVAVSLIFWFVYPIILDNRLLKYKVYLVKHHADWKAKLSSEKKELKQGKITRLREIKSLKNNILEIYYDKPDDKSTPSTADADLQSVHVAGKKSKNTKNEKRNKK